jgi:hypothetical protein
MHLKRAEQRLRAAPRVLELPPSPPAGPGRTIRKAPFQGLPAGLLIDREDHGARWRMQVQVGDRRHLRAELRVGAMEPPLNPMRPQITFGQQALVAAPADAGHEAPSHGFVDQFGERAGRLALVRGHRLAGQGDQLQARDGRKLRRGSGPRLVVQPTHSVPSESVPPTLDGARMDAHAAGYSDGTTAVFRAEDNAGSQPVTLTTGPRPNSALEFGPLLSIQRQPDARPAATGHLPTASWLPYWAQLFCASRARSVPADFSGGIRGSGH